MRWQGDGKDGSTPPWTVVLGALRGPFPTTFSAFPCHCCLVERAKHMEKHILLINPSHCLFSQESLPSRPHASLLIWLSVVALTVSCDFLAVTDTLGDPRPEVCHPAPKSIYGSCSNLKLDFVSQIFYVLCYSSVIMGWRKRGFWKQHPGVINLDLE